MAVVDAENPLLGETTTCGSLLQKLQANSYLKTFLTFILGSLFTLLYICIIIGPCISKNWKNMLNAVNHGLMQQIWDEVGENDEERDKMLLQLEQECLDVYKRKVDQAVKSRAHLLQALADAQLELSHLLSALGEKSFVGIVNNFTPFLVECLLCLIAVKLVCSWISLLWFTA